MGQEQCVPVGQNYVADRGPLSLQSTVVSLRWITCMSGLIHEIFMILQMNATKSLVGITFCHQISQWKYTNQ